MSSRWHTVAIGRSHAAGPRPLAITVTMKLIMSLMMWRWTCPQSGTTSKTSPIDAANGLDSGVVRGLAGQ